MAVKPDTFGEEMGRLILLYGVKVGPQRLREYQKELSNYSDAVFTEACRQIRRNQEKWPALSVMLNACGKAAQELAQQRDREEEERIFQGLVSGGYEVEDHKAIVKDYLALISRIFKGDAPEWRMESNTLNAKHHMERFNVDRAKPVMKGGGLKPYLPASRPTKSKEEQFNEARERGYNV